MAPYSSLTSRKTRQSIQWTLDIPFHENLIIVTKSTKNSLIMTYFFINPLISGCGNLKMLLNIAQITYYINVHFQRESIMNTLIST